MTNPVILTLKRLYTTVIYFGLSVSVTNGQHKAVIAESRLVCEWTIDDRDSVPDPLFNLRNTGTEALRQSGWKIYFNSIKKPFLAGPDTAAYHLRQVNGDLFVLTAGKKFPVLHPGHASTIRIRIPGIRNYTELPAGFYIVFDASPEKGIPIKNISKENFSTEYSIAQATYRKNEQQVPVSYNQLSPVFPTPLKYTKGNGSFAITRNIPIISPQEFSNETALLVADLQSILGAVPGVRETGSGPAIYLRKGNQPKGGYHLKADKTGVHISASGPEGIFYGIQSLKSMFPAKVWKEHQNLIEIPEVDIEDAPRFGHRALLLDVARNFQSKDKILKLLDLLALYKLNVLHLHLIDDEGWRLEIPGLPELTEVGSRRGHSTDKFTMLPPSYGSGPDSTNPFGSGFYSRKDFIEILRYATARHIKVIPEIESPGHARAAIISMDARYYRYINQGMKKEAEQYLLRDIPDSSSYQSVQGWRDNVMNPAIPSTYRFISKVTGEIVKMYREAAAPIETIHMGGDEVPEGVWEKSPAVHQLLKENRSIGNSYDLWKYYFSKVNEILKSHAIKLYGWEEIGLKRIGKRKWVVDSTVADRKYQVDVWNNIIGTGAEDLAYRMANAGFRVVLSNVTNLYFDMASNASFFEHGMNWGGFVDIDKPFYFIPYNYYLTTVEDDLGRKVSPDVFNGKKSLNHSARQHIVGLQGALWSETITKEESFEYLLLPKLLGLAERAWAGDPAWTSQKDSILQGNEYRQAWSVFTSQIGLKEFARLDYYRGGFRYRIPEPGVECRNGLVMANVQYPGLIIRYTTDGSEPDASSPEYVEPLRKKGTIILKVFNQAGRSGKKVILKN
ncbi:family 20 glycosylhydrolase [Flavihumibacter stibioxidans]|uniref:beta-N-acetylhexosaminidase n=1 Tax=Flavihumibacter stibioxidans TaxID=1834163 RepID=A0ABR7M5J5_9BACT|nr:family 20 glycosylhydrolase [Flavihumibacter stibioxidans]MBC6490290.1 hypothetical protein [Flavihumibacter stibioxidans]